LLVSSILGLLLFRNTGRLAGSFSPKIAGELLRESWPNIIANLAGMAYLRADRVMLASMAGESSAGIYSAAASLVEAWYVLPVAVMNSATPMLTRLYANDPACFQSDLWRLARLHAAAAWSLAIVLAATGTWLVPLLFGSAYAAAGPVLTLLACSLPSVFMGMVAAPWHLNKRLTVAAMRRHLSGAFLNIVLNFLFIPQWGASGAAVATVIAFATAHIFANTLDRRTRPIFHLQWRALCLLRNSPPV
jgi:PST family polysaccharide transporter